MVGLAVVLSALTAAVVTGSVVALEPPDPAEGSRGPGAQGVQTGVLCDFSKDGIGLGWRPLLDGVMGGRSTGGLEYGEDGSAHFRGVLETEGGGFAAIVAPLAESALRDTEGLTLSMYGDGRTYRLGVSTQEDLAGIMYQVDISAEAGCWTEARVPFAAFAPTYHGQPVEAAPISAEEVRCVATLIADGQQGPYDLELRSLKAVAPLLERLDLRQVADPATSAGVDLFLPLHDTVMGGMSSGSLVPDDGFAEFRGTVSLEHNGGFASIRSRRATIDLGGYDGMLVRALGDGKRYRICLTQQSTGDWPLYWADFTAADEWQEHWIAFDKLVPNVFGRTVEAAPIDPTQIETIGIMIADKQAGPFALRIATISAYRTPR